MIAKELISNLVLPLEPSDTLAQALTIMSIYHVKHLPVVREEILMGILSEDNATTNSPETLVRDIQISSTYTFVNINDHVFEVLARLAQNKMTVVPVVDNDEKFIGIITQEDLIKYYANSFSFKEPGSIIVVESSKRGYSFSEIARVIELENGSVLASFITDIPNTEVVLITIKINQQEISSIISALERYDYKINASFTEDEYDDDLKDRYDQLMNYLNV
ncbi:MAG: CBS domain-containing protein [Saprospiraceae bacterium]|nr:CBS domain-containing protein [Bacteroidia bacterium]NNE13380.1 CBS domain-containing protein [Saprospiraceae bacterium]NNL91071.1 CBS domain-containing protein [Saprospiraceae bacterium]